MPTIKLSALVKQDAKKVYAAIKQMEQFPQFIKGVKKLHILERSGNRNVSSWEVEVDGATVIWKEEDIFNDGKYRVDFNMLEGDYAQYTGSWEVKPEKKGARVDLNVAIDYGAPALVEFIGGILKKKTTLALKGMLLAIKKRAEGLK